MWAAPPLRTQFPATNPAAMCRLPVGVPAPSTTTNLSTIFLPINFPIPFSAKKGAAIRLSTGVPRKFQLYSHLHLGKSHIMKRGDYSKDQKFQLYSQLRNLDLITSSNTVVGNFGKSQTRNRQRGAGAGEEQVVEKRGDYSKKQKFQLYSQLRNLDLNTGSNTFTTSQRREDQVVEMRGEQEKKLSGLDVLWALEKANAQKMMKKRKGKDRKGTGQERKGTPEDEALADYGNKNVRALSIKEDWGSRLDELERKLEELMDKYVA